MSDYYTEQLANHKLEIICNTEKVKCFRLYANKDSNLMSTYFTFNPAGICLAGDLTPSLNANFCPYNGLGWFTGEGLSPSYLAEKFYLQKRYNGEATKQSVIQMLTELEAEDTLNVLHTEDRWIDWKFEHDTYDFLQDILKLDDIHDILCYEYDEGEIGWLCALQKAFRREYIKFGTMHIDLCTWS